MFSPDGLVKGGKKILPTLSPKIATTLSIPLIAILALFGIKRMSQELALETQRSD